MRMKILKTDKDLVLKTTKGELVITNKEYFMIKNEKGPTPLVINKEGIQKIEDHFDASFIKPEIQQIWNSSNNFNIIATVGIEFEGKVIYGVGSANTLNLTNVISQAYPAEMAVKRAKATAALELLRKNYVGEERLPLLYSSFDEFQTEDANSNIEIEEIEEENQEKENNVKEEAKEKIEEKIENKEEVKEEVKEENKNEVQEEFEEKSKEESSAGDYVIKTNKYRTGITIRELHEKDAGYFKWLATNKNAKGRYKEYQEAALKFAKEQNISLETA